MTCARDTGALGMALTGALPDLHRRLARSWRLGAAVAVCAVLLVRGVLAAELPELRGRVNDYAELLPANVEHALEEALSQYERETKHQFAILTVESLEGAPIEDYSIRVVEKWKLGSAEADDGVLLLVVLSDRKMRIEVGYGLEGDLPDILAGRIVRDEMAPRFRTGDFPGGIVAAAQAVMKATGGTAVLPESAEPKRRSRSDRTGDAVFTYLPLLFFFGPFLFLRLIRRRRSGFFYLGGFGSGRSFGGGGFGSGGGGFGGGGGGFGGGGASGNW